MTYNGLTLMQRIGLKGEIQTNPKLAIYKAIWLLWDFRTAVNAFFMEQVQAINYIISKPLQQ